MRTINWVCTKSAGWNWQGANGVIGEPDQMSGTIQLGTNAEFWWQCESLILKGGTVGTAAIRHYQEGGQDLVQVFTDARGAWHDQPSAGNSVASQTGETGKSGGISLTAAFVD